jgi:CRP-like cAMP-binding protein
MGRIALKDLVDSKGKVVQEIFNLWEPLTEKQRQIIQKNIIIQRYKRNQYIYRELESPDYMLCLIHGKVKVFKDGIGGRNQITSVIKPIELFGYRAYFAGENYRTSAVAFEQCIIGKIPMNVIDELIKDNSSACIYIIKQLAQQLGTAEERTVNLTQKHIRGRLAETLIFLKDNYGLEEDGYTLSIYLSREDLACLSNMTTSNAIRTLSTFANEKLIAIDGRKIKIIQEEELRKVSNLG